jgi:hypothetical protein
MMIATTAPMSKAIAGEPRLRTNAFWMCDGVNAGLVGTHGITVNSGLSTYQARRPEELQT